MVILFIFLDISIRNTYKHLKNHLIKEQELDDEEENALDENDNDEDSNFGKNDATLLRLGALCLLHQRRLVFKLQ